MAEVHQIWYDEDEDRYFLGDDSIHCGDCFSVLVWHGKPEWVDTSIEINKNGWYLVGLRDIQIGGLWARWSK